MFYLDVFGCLYQHEVRYLLIGGLAMNLLGVPRLTMDLDLLLGHEETNVDAFIRCAQTLQLRPQIPEPIEALKDPQRRRAWLEEKHMIAFALIGASPAVPTIAVVLQHPLDFASAFEHAELKEAGGVPVRVATVDDMITLKRAVGRPQDLADLEHLERLRQVG